MTDNTQPEALRLAHIFDHPIPPDWPDMVAAAAELRRQHARIAELEAELEAVGAGGVQALSQKKATPAIVDKAQAAINSGADSVLEDVARLKEAVGLLEELAEHDNYSTEYDGRMLSICPECGEQDGEHRAACAFVRAKAFLAARKQGANHG